MLITALFSQNKIERALYIFKFRENSLLLEISAKPGRLLNCLAKWVALAASGLIGNSLCFKSSVFKF
ncbi:MAG: hypothetical protein CMQ15_05235 [Gammaproteobacteria bacterium]|nr:hypothetical protein [Gammaproteobacteria bacterium]